MASITREPACRTKGCPAPRSPEWHEPWCGHGTEGHHHHVPKRSQGGKEIVAFPCPVCHDRIDNGDWGNAVFETVEDGKRIRTYRAWDLHNETLIERVIGEEVMPDGDTSKLYDQRVEEGVEAGQGEAESAAAEAGNRPGSERLVSIHPRSPGEPDRTGGSSAAAPSVSPLSSAGEGGAEADVKPRSSREEHQPYKLAVVGSNPTGATPSGAVSLSPAEPSLEVWCREGMELVYMGLAFRDATDGLRFAIGDWMNKGEGMLGEEVYGYLRGFEDVTVRQYSWVAGRVAVDTRVSKLAWTYHRAVAALPPGEQKEWLAKAQEENLSSKELNLAIHGTKPKVKRWTLEELQEHANHYGTPPQRAVILAFLEWQAKL